MRHVSTANFGKVWRGIRINLFGHLVYLYLLMHLLPMPPTEAVLKVGRRIGK